MKKISIKTKLVSLGVVVVALIGTLLLLKMSAASNQVRLVPSSSTVEKNDIFSVDVMLDTGSQDASVATVKVIFDPSKVAYDSLVLDGSAFTSTSPDNEIGDGYVQISRYETNNLPSGNFKLATIKFRTLVDSGTIPFSIDPDSTTIIGGDGSLEIYDKAASSASVVVKESQQPPTPDPEPTPTPDPEPNPTPDPEPEPTPDPEPNPTPDPEPEPTPSPSPEPQEELSIVMLTPSKTKVNKGETFDLLINIDSGEVPINIASIYLNYDITKVQFVSPIDFSDSGLKSTLTEKGDETGSGHIEFARLSTENQPSGNFRLAKIKFKAIASGNASFSVDKTKSEIYSNTNSNVINNILGTVNTATVTVVDPTTGTGPTTPTPPTNPKPEKPPVINIGSPIKPKPKLVNSRGKKIVSTDYYLNGNYVGTGTADNPVSIPTNGYQPGTYELESRSTAEDGSVETTKEDIKIKSPTIVSKIGWPIAVSSGVVLIGLVLFVVKVLYKQAVPFYKTLG